jgi:hypothetical protein
MLSFFRCGRLEETRQVSKERAANVTEHQCGASLSHKNYNQ